MAGYGLRPVKKTGAGYDTGGFVEAKAMASVITTGTVSYYNGDTVDYTVHASVYGIVEVGVAASTLKTVGVVTGARWTDSNSTPQWGQSYPAGAAKTGTDVFIQIAPAADTVFMIQGINAWAEAQTGTYTQIQVGAGGNDVTGNSSLVADNNTTNTGTFGLQIIDVVRDGVNETSATPDLLVVISPLAISVVPLG
jgi:hypothetical protein